MLCVSIRTLCPIPPLVTLTASTICSQRCFPHCVLLVGKEVELRLNPHRNLCRLYSPIRDPGSVFKMHKIPAAQKPGHIHFPHVLRLCGRDPPLPAFLPSQASAVASALPVLAASPPVFPINLPLLPLPLCTLSRSLSSHGPCNMMAHPVGGAGFIEVRLSVL